MSYDTSDIKQAIEEYYMREIEDNNLVHKGRASRINSLHHWKENDLKYFEELESKAKAFDEISVNITGLRKHMLDSGKSKHVKRVETSNTLEHIEYIIKHCESEAE